MQVILPSEVLEAVEDHALGITTARERAARGRPAPQAWPPAVRAARHGQDAHRVVPDRPDDRSHDDPALGCVGGGARAGRDARPQARPRHDRDRGRRPARRSPHPTGPPDHRCRCNVAREAGASIGSVVRREPVLRHDADLLRERPSRTSATRTRRSSATRSPAGTACSATTCTSSPAPTSTARRCQHAAEAAGKTPQDFVDEIAPLYAAGVAAAEHQPTTTSSAPPSSATRSAWPSCCSAATTPATSSSTSTRASTASRCEEYYTDDELDPGDLCPIHKRPVEYYEEENYFFRLSRFQDRLLDWYAAHPGAIKPEFRGNEALGLIRGGLRDFSVSRTSLQWGIPLPWDPKHVAYVWFDALTNYITAVGFGSDAERFDTSGGRRLPPHRQGHHPPPLRVLAGDADDRPASSRPRAGPSAAGCSSAARR